MPAIKQSCGTVGPWSNDARICRRQKTADPLRGECTLRWKGNGPAASPRVWPGSFFGNARLPSLSWDYTASAAFVGTLSDIARSPMADHRNLHFFKQR